MMKHHLDEVKNENQWDGGTQEKKLERKYGYEAFLNLLDCLVRVIYSFWALQWQYFYFFLLFNFVSVYFILGMSYIPIVGFGVISW